MRRPVINCLLSAALFLAAVGFLSCRRERLVVYDTPQMAVERQFWVRVLLAECVEQSTLKIRGHFSVLGASGVTIVPETIFDQPGLPMEVKVSAAGLNIAGRNFVAMEVTILPDEPHIFTVDGADYRGKLLIKANNDYTTFDLVNIVPLESYLSGVVTAEMPAYWQAEALKAQAIAARTYCLFNRKKFENIRHWDVKKTTESQVYLGVRGETPQSWKAVNDTWGQVLVCTQNGAEGLFPAYYSSSCGGHTENAKNVFGDSFSALAGADCPYCKEVAKPSIFFWPMAQFDKTEVKTAVQLKYPKLKAFADIANIVSTKQSDYSGFSRLTLVKLEDSKGRSDFLRAEDLRLTLDPSGNRLRSTACKIVNMQGRFSFVSGRGYGHGVGLCQCGAEGMARRGKNASEILSHYYPGSKLTRVY
ncbi:MAG: SpoIID/LytB domain-containing protein [Sedimentisphaerales bacterium]|nr:SpoIID/LytB domain-containing protein [Sedimentisphaerales bacterium]